MAERKREDPVSVLLPAGMRRRIAAEAKRRGLKLSPAIRTLLSERLHELDDAETLTRAEEWQRAEAWAAWERMEAEGPEPATEADLEAAFAIGGAAPTGARGKRSR